MERAVVDPEQRLECPGEDGHPGAEQYPEGHDYGADPDSAGPEREAVRTPDVAVVVAELEDRGEDQAVREQRGRDRDRRARPRTSSRRRCRRTRSRRRRTRRTLPDITLTRTGVPRRRLKKPNHPRTRDRGPRPRAQPAADRARGRHRATLQQAPPRTSDPPWNGGSLRFSTEWGGRISCNFSACDDATLEGPALSRDGCRPGVGRSRRARDAEGRLRACDRHPGPPRLRRPQGGEPEERAGRPGEGPGGLPCVLLGLPQLQVVGAAGREQAGLRPRRSQADLRQDRHADRAGRRRRRVLARSCSRTSRSTRSTTSRSTSRSTPASPAPSRARRSPRRRRSSSPHRSSMRSRR